MIFRLLHHPLRCVIDVPPQFALQLDSNEQRVREELPMRRSVCGLVIAAMSLLVSGSIADGGEGTLKVAEAWIPVTEKVGADVPLLLTVRNESDAGDALLRVRCPVSNFSEKHTVDRGEGAPAMRVIRSIPIAAGGTTVLKQDGYHVMLLQTRQPLAAGEKFTCSIAFEKAGTVETEVSVRTLR
jgi:copper(I)-binding protein